MKKLAITLLVLLLCSFPCNSMATVVEIAQFEVSNYGDQAGLSLFGSNPDTGYFTVGIGDFDYFTMFRVHLAELNSTLSYWNGPPIMPGQDTGDYFIRTITGYPFTYEEARAFSLVMPMIYGYDNGSAIHHQLAANPQLGEFTINGIYLDVYAPLVDGALDVTTRLYADVDLAPVPEPSSLLLLGCGGAALLLFRRRLLRVA